MKYVVGAKKLREDGESLDKEISTSAKNGKAILNVQIAQLEADVVKLEQNVESAEESYENSKFAIPFDLNEIDDAEHRLNKAKAELKYVKDDLASRKALLKELF